MSEVKHVGPFREKTAAGIGKDIVLAHKLKVRGQGIDRMERKDLMSLIPMRRMLMLMAFAIVARIRCQISSAPPKNIRMYSLRLILPRMPLSVRFGADQNFRF